jgi:hypothetical protein
VPANFEKAWNKLSATRTEAHFELWRQDRDFHAWKDRMHDERPPVPEHVRTAHRGIKCSPW